MNLRSFCSRACVGYQELIIDDALVNKVYELSFPSEKRGAMLGIPDGCIDVQFLQNGSQEECFVVGSYLQGRRSGSADHERCFGIKFVTGLEYCFSKLDAPAVFDRRMEAPSLFDADVLQDIVHLPLPFEERARLAAAHFGVESKGRLFQKSDFLVAFITKTILDNVGVIRIEDIVERTGYSHKYVSTQFKDAVGCTMKTYANIIRTQNAIRLLSDRRYSTMTGLDIGTGLGYYDQSHFDREFKKYTTLTPGDIRSENSHLLFL